MTDTEDSCLVQKLSHYIELDDLSRHHLAQFELDQIDVQKHEIITRIGTETSKLYVVKSGWLYAFVDMPDGRRQLVRIFHPGDIIGFPDLAFHHATTTVQASEPACLCPFPKKRLDDVFRLSPRLTALLFALAVRDQVIFMDLVRAMGRMSARERIVSLLLDILHRLRITNVSMTDTMRLPLSQTEIGDLLGLTNVYVSKTFRRLEEDGFIKRDGGTIRILKEGEMTEMTDFSNRYQDMDISWFPSYTTRLDQAL
ncbi:Crp/Fnr family transcriptional regulator [Aestuariibius insulae]|uniref:Crp/Fnr family transcriptional regulator n=1 Tax=Aestuariibius insulae TaxID=2058287 RepID=UPI00345E0AF6